MTSVDWLIIVLFCLFITAITVYATKFNRSVADFLAANRCAGRYVLATAEGVAGLGAITIVGWWEMYYKVGFTPLWWNFMMFPVGIIITITGFVIYRYRETKAMTVAQFFEMRYNKSFRVFSAIICFISGILNFGIFPAVGTQFFISFAGIPININIGNFNVPTYPIVMFVLIAVSLYIALSGGQITVMITDFFQGLLSNLIFLILLCYIFIFLIDWSQISQALLTAPAGQSMVNPFKGEKIEDFNCWYFVIGMFGAIYSFMSWQGAQAYNCSAKNPHEAQMAKILGFWRSTAQLLLLVLLPICAYVVMHIDQFNSVASDIKSSLALIGDETLRGQMIVPMVLKQILPVGVKGALCAIILIAFISVHDTYLHSWGSIFVQDILIPILRKKPDSKQHMKYLRISCFSVAVFIFIFSLIYRQTEAIFMFFALTGAIYLGGSGAALIGGLYWKRGTAMGAFGAMITGAVLALTAFVLQPLWPVITGNKFPIQGQYLYGITMLLSSVVYVVLSLASKQSCNMDKLFKRGIYAESTISENIQQKISGKMNSVLRCLGMSNEFTKIDKLLFYSTILWGGIWWTLFMLGSLYGMVWQIDDVIWMKFWMIYLWISFVICVIFSIWFAIGGVIDVKNMLYQLSRKVRDENDNGIVRADQNIIKEGLK